MNITDFSPRQVYDKYRRGARKELGQNFIFDEGINRRIVDTANLEDKVVLEVGPGPGGLTLEILRRNVRKLYVVEYDGHWCDVWRDLQKYTPKLELIQCDALKFDVRSIRPQVIVSNLPYNISTKLLFQWLPNFDLFEELVLMFQKEVADRIIASPRTKDYGQLSVMVQWLSDVSKIFDLSPEDFFPSPKVHSSVLRFVPRRVDVAKYSLFEDFLKKAFLQRRKILKKNVSLEIMQKLYEMGYAENLRAEEISVEDYIQLIPSL